MIFEFDVDYMPKIIMTIGFIIIAAKIIFIIISPIAHLGKTIRKKEHEQQFQNLMNQQQFQQFMNESVQRSMEEEFQSFTQWSLDEATKSVTPFEHGGYDINQGNSFNNPF